MSAATATFPEVKLRYKEVGRELMTHSWNDIKATIPATGRVIKGATSTAAVATRVGSLKALDGISFVAKNYVSGCDKFVATCDRRKVAMAAHVVRKYGYLVVGK